MAQQMSNYHWVCFRCHEAVRRHGSADNVRCPSCGQACENIGTKTPVPPKSKPKRWQELAKAYAQARKGYFERQSASLVRKAHDLEQEIVRIDRMEPNEGRLALLARLKAELVCVRQRQVALRLAEPFYLAGKLPPRTAAKNG